MIDFHSHFLPGIDDGAESIECSLMMLEEFKKQGIGTVVATPHFYETRGKISDFISDRDRSYNSIKNRITANIENYPQIVLGAEVALTPDLAKNENLESLCLGKTNTILIELPYNGYYEWIPYAVYDIISRRNLVPVLAHFERFCTNKKDIKQYENLLSLDINVQVNTESLLSGNTFKIVKNLVKIEKLDVIGSDSHNMSTRRCTFLEGTRKIEKKFGREFLEELNENAKKLISFR